MSSVLCLNSHLCSSQDSIQRTTLITACGCLLQVDSLFHEAGLVTLSLGAWVSVWLLCSCWPRCLAHRSISSFIELTSKHIAECLNVHKCVFRELKILLRHDFVTEGIYGYHFYDQCGMAICSHDGFIDQIEIYTLSFFIALWLCGHKGSCRVVAALKRLPHIGLDTLINE